MKFILNAGWVLLMLVPIAGCAAVGQPPEPSTLVARQSPDTPAARRNLTQADLPAGYQLSSDSPVPPNPADTTRAERPGDYAVDPARCPLSPLLPDAEFHGRFTRTSADNRAAASGFAFGWSTDTAAAFNFVALERDLAQCDHVLATRPDGSYRDITSTRLDTRKLGADECFGVSTITLRATAADAPPRSEKAARIGCRVGAVSVFGVLGESSRGEKLSSMGDFVDTMRVQVRKVREAG
ncbi:hypothetical protein [Nocardia arthritidis]|uniref:Sensor domain-containing protein n=1 Tax=Nocardia arthritidis TaxID=228602 RepID=A0A6G9Y9P2_9NOCA|nr:hypothetical protein [Nocardia arthritidis]QIS09942.1 hypothetical protein F5544_10220 [Nocardia arthritidis]